MGENPYKSIRALIAEKNGESGGFSGNAATRRGNELEPVARSHYCNATTCVVEPAVLVHTQRRWQAASIDGIDQRGQKVVEIKCGWKSYLYSSQKRQPPPYYVGQLQHILAVTDLENIDYYAFYPGREPILLNVVRDNRYIERLLEAEQRFAARYLSASPTEDEPDNKVMILCQGCAQRLRVPAGRELEVTCPRCRMKFRART